MVFKFRETLKPVPSGVTLSAGYGFAYRLAPSLRYGYRTATPTPRNALKGFYGISQRREALREWQRLKNSLRASVWLLRGFGAGVEERKSPLP